MRASSPSSIFASLILHAFVAAVIFLTTMFVAQSAREEPKIFELVAGPPTAPDALEAPALGNTPNPVKVTVPKAEPAPEKPQPQAVETPPPTAPAETAPPKPDTKPAKPDMSLAKQLKQSTRTSYRDYLKKHPIPKQTAVAPSRAANAPQVDVQGIANGVRGGSTANTRGGGGGKAMTREESDELSTYISFLMQELKRAFEAPPGVSDQLSCKVTFDITASGAILNPHISKPSGNRDFDEAVLDAFRRMRSIGPTPTRRPDTWTVTFKQSDTT